MSYREGRRDLFKLTTLNGFGLAVRIVSALAVNKVMASVLGSAGFAVYAQAQNLLSLLMSFATNGLSAGVTKLTADNTGQREKVHAVWGTSMLAAAFVGLLLALTLLMFAEPLAVLLFNDAALAPYIRLVAIATPFGCCAPVPLAALNGQLESMSCVIAPMLANALAAVFTIVLCLALGLKGTVGSVIAAQIIALLINAYFFFRKNAATSYILSRDLATLRPLLSFALMALVGGAATQASTLYVRTAVSTAYGWEQAGHWQAIMKISEIYLALATSTLTIYYLPRLSTTANALEFRRLLVPAMSWILPMTLLGCAAVFMFRHAIVEIVFTTEFAPIGNIIWAQLLADFLRISSYFFAMVMWAKKMSKTFMVTEVAYAGFYAALADHLLGSYGLIGALYAQAGAYFFYLIVTMFVAFRLAPWNTHA